MNDNMLDERNKCLLILGNGFDLQCGLNTTYDNFFNLKFGIILTAKIHWEYLKNISKINVDYKDILYERKSAAKKFFRQNLYKNNNSIKTLVKEYVEKFSDELKELNKIDTQDTNLTKRVDSLNSEFKKFITNNKTNSWELIALAAFAFIKNESPIMWSDVERMIYQVITWVLGGRKQSDAQLQKEDDLVNYKYYTATKESLDKNADKNFVDFFNNYSFEDDAALNKPPYQSAFRKVIEKEFYDPYESTDILSSRMLDEIVKFESIFSNFINQQTGLDYEKDKKTVNYYQRATELVRSLVYPNNNLGEDTITIIDILNFNYTFDVRFKIPFLKSISSKGKWQISSWNNIHGVACWNSDIAKQQYSQLFKNKELENLPAPIFGVDNHEIFEIDSNENDNWDDPRIIFTKSYRLIDNHVNSIRNTAFQKKVDTIIVYGHSLNRADYSYFESIFDMYDVFNSEVKLRFYYWRGYSKNDDLSDEKKKVVAKQQERKAMKNIAKLLNSYGSTLKNEHGENIINKLVLEQRLSLLPSPLI